MQIKQFTNWRMIILAAFVTAGYFKAAIETPIDLTLALAVAVMLICAFQLVLHRWRVPKTAFLVIGLFALMALPLLWSPSSTYALEKTSRLFTLVPLATIAPILVCHSRDDVRKAVNALAAVGAIMAVGALTMGTPASEYEGAETTVFGSNTITLGRATGLTCVVCVLVVSWHKRGRYVALSFLGLALVALLSSGSRGPLGAFVLTSLALLALRTRGRRGLVRRVALASVVATGVVFAFYSAPELARYRINLIFQGQPGGSGEERVDLYSDGIAMILNHPQGIGWGGFAQETSQTGFLYPHNLPIEVLAEAGWVVGTVVLLGLWHIWNRTRHGTATYVGQLVFAVLTFALLNSFVSGDVPDNRLLFFCLGLAIADYTSSQAYADPLTPHARLTREVPVQVS